MDAPKSGSSALAIRAQTGLVASDIDPSAMIEFATKQAKVLAKVIEDQHLYVVMGKDKKTGKERRHVEVEGWMTLGAMNGLLPATESVIAGHDAKGNYTATAIVAAIRVNDGIVVARAEGFCSSKESKWSDRDEYAIRSMAQTRATSKVFRQALAWVMVLAGFAATPAEEIPGADTAKKFDAMPVDAEGKRKIDAAIFRDKVEDGNAVLDKDGKPIRVPIYADDAQRAKVISFMQEYGFKGWHDFNMRGGNLIDEVFAILNVPTEFNPDSVDERQAVAPVAPAAEATPAPAAPQEAATAPEAPQVGKEPLFPEDAPAKGGGK